jgi:hypothetical protein
VAFSAAQWLLARRSALSSQRLPRQERALHLRVHSEDAGRPRLIAGLVSPDAETLYRIIAIPLTIRHLQLCFADDAAPTKANWLICIFIMPLIATFLTHSSVDGARVWADLGQQKQDTIP